MIWFIAALAVAALLALRLLFVMFVSRGRPLPVGGPPVKTMVVLGSGGHTAEMLMMVEHLDRRHCSPRVYVAATTDRMSATKALGREAAWAGAAGSGNSGGSSNSSGGSHDKGCVPVVELIPRSREVGQSYVTSVATTLYSLAFAAWVVLKHRPRLLLVNGPGTCIPVCAAAFLYRVLGIADCRITYVESIARVRRLSLSAKLLRSLRMADALFVQWPEMAAHFPGTVYAGRLY